MAVQHDKAEIFSYLRKKTVGDFATLDKKSNNIRLRVMYYGLDDRFNCYLMSTRGSAKIDQIVVFPVTSFLVFGLEEPYDSSWEVEIDGKARLLERPEDIDFALKELRERNPFAEVAIESGITGQFDLIKLTPRILRFRIYGEALKGVPPTVLEF